MEQTFYACDGLDSPQKWWQFAWRFTGRRRSWRLIYDTPESAEAHSRDSSGKSWIWDGKPAAPITLAESQENAKKLGDKGTALVTYQRKKFGGLIIVLGQWRVDEQ